jgi:hypothetical protein
MTKQLMMMGLGLLSLNTFNAQINDGSAESRIRVGVKGGLNLSNVYDSRGQEFNADSKFGFAGGGFVSIPIGELIGIQPEILLSQKGFQGTGSLLGSSYSFTRTTTYLDIPLLFALRPTPFLTFVAGPQISFLLNQKDVFGSATTNIAQQTVFDNDNIRKNTVCFTGGLDINLNNLVLGGRVGWDLMKNIGDGTSETPRYKNVWYQATIGVRF